MRAHVGTAADFLARHCHEIERTIRTEGHVPADILADLFNRVTDDRTLRLAVEDVRTGGAGAGVDGVSPRDLDHRSAMQLADGLRDTLRAGTYRPGPERVVRIPKDSGGFRSLSLPTVADRVVQRAIVTILTPIVDPCFEAGTLGGRPGTSTLDALAFFEKQVRAGNQYPVIADIKSAFDVVPHPELQEVIEAKLGRSALSKLIMRIVRANRTRGISQGGPLSPMLLNLLLDTLLDKPLRSQHPTLHPIRWIDDLVVACPTAEVANSVLKDIETLTNTAKMPIKPEAATSRHVIDLNHGEHANWLGYQLSLGTSGLEVRMGEKAWKKLQSSLKGAHRTDLPAVQARQATQGWVEYLGPCLPLTDVHATYERITALAAEQGFEELPTEEELRTRWERAYERHLAVRTKHGLPPPAVRAEPAAPPRRKNADTRPNPEEEVIPRSRHHVISRAARTQTSTMTRANCNQLRTHREATGPDTARRGHTYRPRPPPHCRIHGDVVDGESGLSLRALSRT